MALQLTESPYKIGFSRNPLRYVIVTNTLITTPGLAIEVELFFRKFSDQPPAVDPYTPIIRLALTPDKNGRVQIDWQKVLDSLVEYKLPPFAVGITRAFEQLGQYYTLYREVTTAAPDPNTWQGTNNPNVVLKGGLPYERWEFNNYFANFNYPHKYFLTWQPSGRNIGLDELAWLTFLHSDPPDGPLVARVNIVFTDGTNQNNVQYNFPDPVAPQFSLYRIPAGPYQLNLIYIIPPGKTIHFYEIQIFTAAGTMYSPPYAFYIDYVPDYKKEQLNYFGSLGALDSVRLLGDIEKQTDYSRDVAERNTDGNLINDPSLIPMEFNQQVLEKTNFKGNLGWMGSQRAIDIFRELLLSKAVYTVRYERWWPVNVTNKQGDLGSANASLHNLVVEYSYAFTNENYAPEWLNLNGANTIGGVSSCPLADITSVQVQPDGSYKLNWNKAPRHVSFELHVFPMNDPSLVQIFYTTDNFYFLGAMFQGYGVRMRANCGTNMSPLTNDVAVLP